MIGWSIGAKKNSELVKQAFLMSDYNLKSIWMFHSDRGSEFKKPLLEDMVEGFTGVRYNHHRLHGSLSYQRPMERRQGGLIKTVLFGVAKSIIK